MKSIQSRHYKQYTVRSLSPQLDQRLRQRGRESGKSLNEVVLETLAQGVGLWEEPILHHDLDALAGTWKEDKQFEEALQDQDRVDPKIWS